jgi:hypothetical protein
MFGAFPERLTTIFSQIGQKLPPLHIWTISSETDLIFSKSDYLSSGRDLFSSKSDYLSARSDYFSA